jgi:hypothetical protein
MVSVKEIPRQTKEVIMEATSTPHDELTLVTCACGCGEQWIVPWDEYDYIKSQKGGRFYYLSTCEAKRPAHFRVG